MGRIPKRKRSSEALNITDIGTTDKTIEQARAQPDPVVPSKGRRALDHVKKRVGAAADAARDSVKKIHALAPRTGPVPPVDLRSWVLTAATTQAPQPSGPFPKPPGLEKGLYDRQIMAEFNTIPSLRPTDFAQRRLLDGAGYEEPLRDLFLPHSYSGKSTTPRACMMNGLSIYIQVTLFFRELWAQAPTPAHMEFGARLMGGIFDLHSTKVHRFDGYFKFKPEHVRRRLVQQASMKRSTDPAITRAAGLWELALHVATQHALFLKDQKDTPGPQGFTAEETTFFDRLEKLSVVYGSPAASQSFKILPRDPRDPLWVDELASRIYQVKDLLCGSDILLGVWGPKTRNLHHAVRNITMNRELEVKVRNLEKQDREQMAKTIKADMSPVRTRHLRIYQWLERVKDTWAKELVRADHKREAPRPQTTPATAVPNPSPTPLAAAEVSDDKGEGETIWNAKTDAMASWTASSEQTKLLTTK